jgi:hypothetical protein
VLKPHGYSTITDPGARRLVEEHDTITCIHCGGISMTQAGHGTPQVMIFRPDGSHYLKEASKCRSCSDWQCPRCADKPCDNRHRRLDREEEAARPKLII